MYNKAMDIQKINSDAEKQFNTKQLREHRRFLREQQVARQKFLLIFLPVCLLAAVRTDLFRGHALWPVAGGTYSKRRL